MEQDTEEIDISSIIPSCYECRLKTQEDGNEKEETSPLVVNVESTKETSNRIVGYNDVKEIHPNYIEKAFEYYCDSEEVKQFFDACYEKFNLKRDYCYIHRLESTIWCLYYNGVSIPRILYAIIRPKVISEKFNNTLTKDSLDIVGFIEIAEGLSLRKLIMTNSKKEQDPFVLLHKLLEEIESGKLRNILVRDLIFNEEKILKVLSRC